jgi:putative NADPH-quinone reductase
MGDPFPLVSFPRKEQFTRPSFIFIFTMVLPSALLYSVPGVRLLQTKLNQLTSYVPPPPPPPPPSGDGGGSKKNKILLVHAHPVHRTSFSAAIADEFERSAAAAGHDVRRINLCERADPTKCYRPNLSQRERLDYYEHLSNPDETRLAADVREHLSLLKWCDTLVFVYPTWWMDTPASLKGWFDRTLVAGHAFEFPQPGTRKGAAASLGLVPKLTNVVGIVGISTYGAPWGVVLAAGDNGRRMISNAVRHSICPAATVTWLALYNCDAVDPTGRAAFLRRVRRLAGEL